MVRRVHAYSHMCGSIGVLVELGCESDAGAQRELFLSACNDICLQVCATAPKVEHRMDRIIRMAVSKNFLKSCITPPIAPTTANENHTLLHG